MYQYFARILPKRVLTSYKNLLGYCRVKTDHEKFIGFVIIFGLVLSLAFALALGIILNLSLGWFVLSFIILYIAIEFIIYMYFSMHADSQGKKVENILPDVLQLMSLNLKAGMTTDKALLVSARPEFGALEKELSKAGKQVLAGKSIKEALLEIPKGIKSKVVERTIRIIVEGIESGGELSHLLEQTAEDIQQTKIINEEIHANILMYAIFIFFAASIGAPLLFGISTYLVQTLGTEMSSFEMPETLITGIHIGRGELNVGSSFLIMFSITALFIISFFGSMIIGIVKSNKEKEGLKIFPLMFIISITIFIIVRMFVSSIFSGI